MCLNSDPSFNKTIRHGCLLAMMTIISGSSHLYLSKYKTYLYNFEIYLYKLRLNDNKTRLGACYDDYYFRQLTSGGK